MFDDIPTADVLKAAIDKSMAAIINRIECNILGAENNHEFSCTTHIYDCDARTLIAGLEAKKYKVTKGERVGSNSNMYIIDWSGK